MTGRRNKRRSGDGDYALVLGSRCGGGRDPTKYEAMRRWIHDHGRCARKFTRTAYAGGPVRTCGSAGKQVAVGEGMSMRQLVRCWRGVGGLGDVGRDARLG